MGKSYEGMSKAELTAEINTLGKTKEMEAHAVKLNKKVDRLTLADLTFVLTGEEPQVETVEEVAAREKAELDAKEAAEAEAKAAQDKIDAEDAEKEKIKAEGTRATNEEVAEFNSFGSLVVITDHQTKASSEEHVEGRILPVPYGNTVTGRLNFNVKLDGLPQVVPNAVIKKLSKIMTSNVLTPNPGSKETKVARKRRFSVAPAGEISEKMLKEKAIEQSATRGLNL